MLKNKRVEFKKFFPKRRPETHKGDYGRVYLLAGSPGMLGAAVLCSRGALKVGAGLVYLADPGSGRDCLNLATPEVIVARDDRPALAAQAVALGPGLGERRARAKGLLMKLSRGQFSGPVVVDADGLNAFSGLPELQKLKLKLILTPHPGEMGRLLGLAGEAVQRDRARIAAETARALNCVVVLKGHRTIVAGPGRNSYINNTGNPGMATGGAGDILAGMIAGLAAQGLAPFDAAAAGVYLHGLAGDLAAQAIGEYGLVASDLVDRIPEAILRLNHAV